MTDRYCPAVKHRNTCTPYLSLAKSEILRKGGWSEVAPEYTFVLDAVGRKLAPTKANKGWYLIRKGKAKLVNKFPMVIQLFREVENPDTAIHLGIDDGSKHVGFGLV